MNPPSRTKVVANELTFDCEVPLMELYNSCVREYPDDLDKIVIDFHCDDCSHHSDEESGIKASFEKEVVNEDYEAELIAYNKYVDQQERARIEAKNLKKRQADIDEAKALNSKIRLARRIERLKSREAEEFAKNPYSPLYKRIKAEVEFLSASAIVCSLCDKPCDPAAKKFNCKNICSECLDKLK